MNNYKIMIRNTKENITYSFKYKYVQAKRICIKENPYFTLKGCKKTIPEIVRKCIPLLS